MGRGSQPQIPDTRHYDAGPPGVGKTHLSIALGREAILAGYTVQFTTATTPVAGLAKAHGERRLDEKLLALSKPKLLIVEESHVERRSKADYCLVHAIAAVLEYRVFDHPDFERFASGVMASPFAPCHILDDANLKMRFWPCALAGLGPGLIWSPHAGLMSAPAQGERISRWPSPNSRACRRSRRSA